MAASLASGAAVVRARACARARARACARARARARAVLVLVLVLVPCSFCVSSPSCSSCPSWSSFVVLVRGPRCQRCAGSSYFFACVLVLLLEEQRRENPHATAGNVREQSYALTCSTCLFASAVFAEDPPPSSTEQQSAPSRWREFRAKLFFSAAGPRGRRKPAQTEPGAVRPPFFPGEGARANPWGQLPSITAEMGSRTPCDCTR